MTLHGNDDAVIVIEQNGTIIQPINRQVDTPRVVRRRLIVSDHIGYETSIDSEFSIGSVNIAAPFTVIVANYEFASVRNVESRFAIDPRTIK